MKIVIVDSEYKVIDIYENCNNIVWQGDQLSWDYGTVPAQNALVLDDSVAVSLGDIVDPSLDQKSQFKKLTLEEENAKLKQDLLDTQLALTEVYEQLLALQAK